MKKLNPDAQAYTPSQFSPDFGGGHPNYGYGSAKPNPTAVHMSSHRPHPHYKGPPHSSFPVSHHSSNPHQYHSYMNEPSPNMTQFPFYSPQNSLPSVTPFVPPPQPKESITPRIILVSGYKKMGKTTVAFHIAEKFGFKYINIKKRESNSSGIDLVQRFAPLKEALATIQGKKGIVIDDATNGGRFEPYYIAHLLQNASPKPLHLNGVITIPTELKAVPGRVEEKEVDKQSHPEGYEFCESLELQNGSSGIILLDSSDPLNVMLKECDKEMEKFLSAPPLNLKLPEVNFIPNAPLVTDLELVEKIIQAEAIKLQTTNCNYLHSFPYVLPDFILEYSLFAKMALLFKNYLLLPWIWEEKISIIGYDESVYVHVAAYKLLFELKDAPELQKLAQSTEIEDEPFPLKFSLEAVMKNDKIYISDMMYLDGSLGSDKTLRERVKLLHEKLGSVNDPNVVLLKHFPVNKIEDCINEYKDIAPGVIFIHPDGMKPGTYDNRNIVFYCSDVKSFPLRLWNGVEEDDVWTFDGYALEVTADYHPTNLKVVIPKDIVEKNGLNNGHIVEVTTENAKKKVYRFVKRCPWEVLPAAKYFLETVIKQEVNPEVFIKGCASMHIEDVDE